MDLSSIKTRLEQLRSAFQANDVQGFLIPRTDEYQGEFVAPYAERLLWLTGFSGSAGMAVVLENSAAIFTDSRYILQIRGETDPDLYEIVNSADVQASAWIAERAEPGSVIGYDPWLHTPEEMTKLKTACEACSIQFKPIINIIDELWHNQPEKPSSEVFLFPKNVAGLSAQEKVQILSEKLMGEEVGAFVFSLPESIAWILNIRGQDTSYIPVAHSYAVLESSGQFHWFIDESRLPGEVTDKLGFINIHPSEFLKDFLNNFFTKSGVQPIALDYKRTPVWFLNTLKEQGIDVKNIKDPSVDLKAIKTKAEQEAIQNAHIIDGVAMVRFLFWLEQESDLTNLYEYDIVRKLEVVRQKNDLYQGPSFPTIAGFGSNGAIVHYRPSPEDSARITSPGVLLVDSGGQYTYGTTDITRTVSVGEVSEDVKDAFTRVLKAHIAVASASFPDDTTGVQIDALARAPLWDAGMDYGHGTGHGVGCYLQVHEEAANLSPRGQGVLKPGMLFSNEPGYYKEGAFGIRIENLVFVKQSTDEMLEFQTVSLCPIDLSLVIISLMSSKEKKWLNAYHSQVFEHLSPHLDKTVKTWLYERTRPI